MDASTIVLPAHYAVLIWAPVLLLTVACGLLLMFLLRPEAPVSVAKPLPEMPCRELPRQRNRPRRGRELQPARKLHLLPRERYVDAMLGATPGR